jgi:hypothetical protein
MNTGGMASEFPSGDTSNLPFGLLRRTEQSSEAENQTPQSIWAISPDELDIFELNYGTGESDDDCGDGDGDGDGDGGSPNDCEFDPDSFGCDNSNDSADYL